MRVSVRLVSDAWLAMWDTGFDVAELLRLTVCRIGRVIHREQPPCVQSKLPACSLLLACLRGCVADTHIAL